MKATDKVVVLVVVGLCALIIAGYYQPFEVYQGYGLHYPTTVYCSVQKWWWPDCHGRFYVTIFEMAAVVAFAAAARAYLNRPRS